MSGDVAKYVALTRGEGAALPHAPSRVASSLLADRLCGILVLLWLGAVLVPLAGGQSHPSAPLLVGGGMAGALAVSILLRPGWRRWLAARWPRLAAPLGTLAAYRGALLARALVAALLFNIVMIAVNAALGRAFGAPLPLALLAVAVPLISAAQAVPLAPNGLGVREGAYLYFLGQAGVAPAVALSMGLAYYGLMVVVGLLGGLLLVVNGLRPNQPLSTPLPAARSGE